MIRNKRTRKYADGRRKTTGTFPCFRTSASREKAVYVLVLQTAIDFWAHLER
jgi:hypothetical protein